MNYAYDREETDAMTDTLDRMPTDDEAAGMSWWNALSEDVRRQKLAYLQDLKREPTAAIAWEIEKRDRRAAREARPAPPARSR